MSLPPPNVRQSPPARARGFSLIEVIMATCVLAFAIMTSIITVQYVVRDLDGARMASAAAQAMQNEVESIRLMSWSGIESLPVSATVTLPVELTSDTAVRDRMSLQREVADVPDTGTPALVKEITLTARWTAVTGTAHQRIFRMRYAKNGLYDYYYSSAGGS